MNHPTASLLAGAFLLLAALGATAQATPAGAADPAPAALVAEGQRLVEQTALCIDCHSPRLPTGDFDRSRWLQGGPLPFRPAVEMPWAPVAPAIAGLPGYTDAEAVRFLTTGIRRNGAQPLPPMPAFRFNDAEARAIIAYLRSLTPR